MKSISLVACIAICILSCTTSARPQLDDSLWKMRKVEILKDDEVQKIIDTGKQYWSFKKFSIEIFDAFKVQNILHIKMGSRSFKSYDNEGDLQDEFIIQQLNDENLAISSKKKVENGEYNIVYYLDKIKDTSERLRSVSN